MEYCFAKNSCHDASGAEKIFRTNDEREYFAESKDFLQAVFCLHFITGNKAISSDAIRSP
jgi:hypothetical protein